MIQLTPDESRVLGVLIEKDRTTPEQYPLSLNAVTNGCNQKNNREPVLAMEEHDVFEALESLRAKGLVIRSDVPGQRVNKYRHNTQEVLRLHAGEIAIMAELLLRGPQTLGELRGRATRMQPLESLEAVKEILRILMEREEPLIRLLPPSPGSRAERYMQLLCPDLHSIDAPAAGESTVTAPRSSSSELTQRVESLESQVAELKDALRRLATAVGEPDPTIKSS